MEISKIAQGGASINIDNKQASLHNVSGNTDSVKNESRVLSKQEAQQAVEGFNEILTASKAHIKFQYHDKLKEYYVTIVDENTQEVIKEIPPKKLLDMVAAMWEQIGLIVDKKI